jgi:PTS system mannose-specific IIB component
MEIALVRVDNRLVHGQILEAWVPFLKATRIAVVDDQVAGDFFRETVIRMAVPREVAVTIHSVEEFAAGAAENGRGPKEIVLFSCIADALKAYDLGFRFKTLNIGNIYNENCSLCCTPSVLLSDEDIRDVFSLYERGVEIELRRVPREKPLDFRDVVRRRKN